MTFVTKIKKFFASIYEKLARINDSPERIAAGFGLGAFLGLLPGTGPIAALILAAIFRVNKLAALAGALITNTWLSIVTFVLAIKVGSALTGTDWHEVYEQWKILIKDFQWSNLQDILFSKITLSILAGYGVVGLSIGLISYLAVLIVLKIRAKPR